MFFLRYRNNLKFRKNMKYQLIYLSFFVIFIGCASAPPGNQNVINEARDGFFCEKVTVAGSRLPKKVCYEKGMKEEISKKSKEALKREQNRNRVRINSPSE